MRARVSFLIIGLSCLLGLQTIFAQGIDPRLYISRTTVAVDYVQIQYEINYGGFVELHLFDEEDKKVWIKGEVRRRLGQYTFKIPAKPLEPGKRYTFYLRYKGEEYHGSFYAS